jgi:hypothetical protein
MTFKGPRHNYINLGKYEDKVYYDRVEQSGNYINKLKLAIWLSAKGRVNEITRIVSNEILNLPS